MAQNIFDATLDPNNEIKVNSFDWSHANNLTTQIGRITPVFCDLVPAHSSLRINPTFGLQFMPMVFPIQTRLKARIAFYKYPLRALWKDYRDFVGNFREGLEEPYVNPNTRTKVQKMVGTGSLGDYLGIPSTVVGSYGTVNDGSLISNVDSTTDSLANGVSYTPYQALSALRSWIGTVGTSNGHVISNISSCPWTTKTVISYSKFFTQPVGDIPANRNVSTAHFTWLLDTVDQSQDLVDWIKANLTVSFLYGGSSPNVSNIYSIFSALDGTLTVNSINASSDTGYYIEFTIPNLDLSMVGTTGNPMYWGMHILRDKATDYPFCGIFGSDAGQTLDISFGSNIARSVSEVGDVPWWNDAATEEDQDKLVKLSAYAFRAYEGIYNAYYRDNRNNPYYVDGIVQYNQWIPTYEGGKDDNLYELRYANWERDFLTTAVQSPQQGIAPLVGITTYQNVTRDADGKTVVENRVALVDEDGKRYGVSFESDEEGLNGVNYVELDNGVKVTQARSLVDVVNSGISIADLRNVNAYQKFLELNMRKGYSYKDIVEGRFNVKVRYSDLLMPEFFGGFSRDVQMNAITQTVDINSFQGTSDYANALGSQSGIAGVRGDSNASIECFCDEESIVMGVLIVTPLPVYTQLLPKHFTYRGLLDHYNPEFNHIGFQPILYKEVAPLQTFHNNPDNLVDTFGYNRPWYEYCQKYDQAHGEFRTTMNKWLMNRTFNVKPELSQSFLLIDPDQVNDVFSVTETTDKIYGQVFFDITAKLPIARVAIPRLD